MSLPSGFQVAHVPSPNLRAVPRAAIDYGDHHCVAFPTAQSRVDARWWIWVAIFAAEIVLAILSS